jgi:hypothetical protein
MAVEGPGTRFLPQNKNPNDPAARFCQNVRMPDDRSLSCNRLTAREAISRRSPMTSIS